MSGSRQTILIVDDEFSIVETLAEVLSWEGYVVLTAPDGRAALESIERSTPSLVLVDYMMPVLDGVGFMRALRSDARYVRLPVILMTAARALPAGDERQYDALLRKPFEVATLLDQVRRLLALATGAGGSGGERAGAR